MSGHSKWSSIKHQKGAADAKRGKLFTKLTKEIIVAVREGGSSVDGNYRLRLAVQKAKDANMPSDNIKRSIEKGEGKAEGSAIMEFTLEGYGPGGAAVLIDVLTDNRNRAVQEIRSTFSKHNGNLGENGSVSWLFDVKGQMIIPTEGLDADELMLQAIDAGAEDVKTEKEYLEVYTAPKELEEVKNKLEGEGVKVSSSELAKIPNQLNKPDAKTQTQTLKLIEKLEDLDDTANVYSNVDFDDEVLENFKA